MINLYMWKENYDCASQGLKTQQNNNKNKSSRILIISFAYYQKLTVFWIYIYFAYNYTCLMIFI